MLHFVTVATPRHHVQRSPELCCGPSFFAPIILALLFPFLVPFAFCVLRITLTVFVVKTIVCALAEYAPCCSCSPSDPETAKTACCTADKSTKTACCPADKSTAAVPTGEDNNYNFTIAAPGVRQADLSVELAGTCLHVTGASKIDERVFSVDKIVKLPDDANFDTATATHKDGALHFTVPKRARTTRTISSMALAPDDKKAVVAPGDEKKAALPPTAHGAAFSVLRECEADAKNVQTPDETLEEVEADEVPRAKTKAGTDKDVPSDGDSADDSSWDAMLDDLDEMGFSDRETNRRALAKHDGSLKRAVKELVTRPSRAAGAPSSSKAA